MAKLSKETTAYKNKLKYIKEYRRNNEQILRVRASKIHDKDILDYLDTLKNKSTLIKQLIRKHMEEVGFYSNHNYEYSHNEMEEC